MQTSRETCGEIRVESPCLQITIAVSLSNTAGCLKCGMGNAQILRRRRHHHLRQQLLALRLRAVALHGRGETFEDAVFEGGDDGVVDIALAAVAGVLESSSAAARTASSTCLRRPRALAAGEIATAIPAPRRMPSRRKSFSDILMPAISRRNAFTVVVETARTVPEPSRYWNMRLPGTSRRMPMARTSLAASHSLRTALPPLALNVSTRLSSSRATFDFSSVVAPRVPLRRA